MASGTRLAVLASGRGSNLAALLDAMVRGDLRHPIVLVISNNSGAGALAVARQHGVATAHVSGQSDPDPTARMLTLLAQAEVGGLVLAGYMKLLDPRLVAAFPERILNVHPAPLPRFGGPGMYGRRVHEAVLAAGVPTTGPSFHLVDEQYDHGRVLEHVPVPVGAADTPETLQARVQAAEHAHYWRLVEQHFTRRTAPPTG